MKSKSTIASALLVLIAMPAFTACDDGEVAVGAGVVGLGAGYALGRSSNRDRQCYSYYDNFGYRRTECRRRHYRYLDMNSLEQPQNSATLDEILAADMTSARFDGRDFSDLTGPMPMSVPDMTAVADRISPEDWGETFKMSIDKSEHFINVLKRSHKGDPEALRSVGFGKLDFELFAKFKLPTTAGIRQLAGNLDMSENAARGMLNRMRAWGIQEKSKRCQQPSFGDDMDRVCNL